MITESVIASCPLCHQEHHTSRGAESVPCPACASGNPRHESSQVLPASHQSGEQTERFSFPAEARSADSRIVFECPACGVELEVAPSEAGEALDCESCAKAIVSPDPVRGRDAMLFADLMERVGVSMTEARPRKIAPFRLRNADSQLEKIESLEKNRRPFRENWEKLEADRRSHGAADLSGFQRTTKKRGDGLNLEQSTAEKTASKQRVSQTSTKSEDGPVWGARFSFGVRGFSAAAAAIAMLGMIGYSVVWFGKDRGPSTVEPAKQIPQRASRESEITNPANPEDALANRPSEPDKQELDELLRLHADVQTHPDPLLLSSAPSASSLDLPNAGFTETSEDDSRRHKITSFENAKKALQDFCGDVGSEARLDYILNSERYAVQVQQYVNENGSDCFQLLELIHGGTKWSDESNRFTSRFLVQTVRNRQGFSVYVYETETGPKLSWPAFVQYHDGTFEKYLDEQPIDPRLYRVSLTRGYSAAPDAPDPETFHCLRVRGSDTPKGRTKTYVPRKSLLGEQLERTLDWDNELQVTAEFQWVKNPGNPNAAPALKILDVHQFYW